jgi:hypothetical protein
MGKRMVKPPIIGYDHCTPISPPTIQFHRKTQACKIKVCHLKNLVMMETMPKILAKVKLTSSTIH